MIKQLWSNPQFRSAAAFIATAVVSALAEHLLHLVNAAASVTP